MSKQLMKTIIWQDVYNGLSYLYGTELEFLDNEVVWRNPRVASSKHLLKFTSRTNYQAERKSPDLPVLTPGASYELVSDVETIPVDSIFIRINFYNRQNELLHFEIMRDKTCDFICPKDTFVYDIILISSGCTAFRFQKLQLFDFGEISYPDLNLSEMKVYHKDNVPEDIQFVRQYIQTIG